MTNFERIKSFTADELAEFLNSIDAWECTPWVTEFDRKYCGNCESIKGTYTNDDDEIREISLCYCEANDKCKFFPELPKAPGAKEIIKLWLDAESEDTDET